MIRSTVLGLVSAVALVASANAADIYRNDVGSLKDAPAVFVDNWSGFYIGANGGYGWQDNISGLDVNGGFGGGQIGYNWQRDRFVFGLEADIQGADISGSVGTSKTELNYFGTVRGRLGFAFERALVYATGGFAYGGVENTFAGVKYSSTNTGWVVGGGLEYALNPAWSVKGEYQFISLKDDNTVSFASRDEYQTVRFGLNYHFGHGYEPLK